MTPETIAWSAGLFDGEGCIVLASPGASRYDRPRLDLVQVVREPVDILQEMYGGKVRALPIRLGWRQQYLWQTYQVDHTLTMMFPYLVVKRKQAELILEYNRLRRLLVGQGRRSSEETRMRLASYRSRLADLRYK